MAPHSYPNEGTMSVVSQNRPQSPPSQSSSSGGVGPGPGHQASILNNIGAHLHLLGDTRRALTIYQQGVDVRMTAIQSERKGVPSPFTEVEISARCRQLEVEEAALRQTLTERGGVPLHTPFANVDMYQMFESRRDENDGSFQTYSDPILLEQQPASSAQPAPASAIEDRDDTYESVVTIHNMGLSHLVSGSYDKASKLFEMALRVMASSPLSSPREVAVTATIHLNVAHVQYKCQDLEAASRSITASLGLWKRLLALSEQQASSSSTLDSSQIKTSVANALSLLGRLHHEAGNSGKALDLTRETLRLRRVVHGDQDVTVASALYNIGLVLQSEGKLDDAIDHVKWFVQFCKAQHQPAAQAHAQGQASQVQQQATMRFAPHLAESLHTLGTLYLENGCVTQAVECLTESAEVRRTSASSSSVATNGDGSAASASIPATASMWSHPCTVDTLCVLGQIMHDSGRYDQALVRYTEALHIESGLVQAHADAARTRREDQQGQDQQDPSQQDQENQHANEEGIATILCSIGQAQQSLGNLDAALESYHKVLSITQTLLSPEHDDRDEFVADLYNIIGNLHLERGETQQAVARFADATRLLRQVAAERGHDVATFLASRGGEAGSSSSSSSTAAGYNNDLPGSGVTVVMGLLGGYGIEFHPHAAAA